MSIAIHSSRAGRAEQVAEAAAVERRRDPSSEPRAPERSADPKAPTGRQALASALSEALAGLSATTGAAAQDAAAVDATEGSDAPIDSRAARAALHEFSRELFDALRPTGAADGGPGRHGRGFAWGRTSLGDIAQRLEALATSLAAPPAGAPAATGVAPASDAAASGDASTPASGDAPASAAGASADPDAIPAPAARVDSPLLAAFRRLVATSSGAAPDAVSAPSDSDQLAALLQRIAQSLSDTGGEASVVGSLVDLSA
jgi:hypothetical protein